MNDKTHRILCWGALLAAFTVAPAESRAQIQGQIQGQIPSLLAPATDGLATGVSVCTNRPSLDLTVDLEHGRIDFVTDAGVTVNLWEGELIVAFEGGSQSRDLALHRASDAWPLAGAITLYVNDTRVQGQTLQADIGGVLETLIDPPRSQEKRLYSVDLWKANADPGTMPTPKLSLKPVETCPPRPPSKEK